MYHVERYLRTLKGYVRNKAQPKGSIAEGYIAETTRAKGFCGENFHHKSLFFRHKPAFVANF